MGACDDKPPGFSRRFVRPDGGLVIVVFLRGVPVGFVFEQGYDFCAFRGTLDFKNGSSGSVGDEQEDALLLSPDVVNRSMPVILCQEEDVEGRHGATIGQLSEELLFYMHCRGIDEVEAKKIMIRARLESVSRLIPDPEIMQKIQYYIENIV